MAAPFPEVSRLTIGSLSRSKRVPTQTEVVCGEPELRGGPVQTEKHATWSFYPRLFLYGDAAIPQR